MKAASAKTLPLRSDYGRGCYRRRIRLHASQGRVRGRLQDDFHDFGVEIEHDGNRVTALCGHDIRVPWTTCPAAVSALEGLLGWELDLSLSEFARRADLRGQCTHLFDLTCLALRHAARQNQNQSECQSERRNKSQSDGQNNGGTAGGTAGKGRERSAAAERGYDIEVPDRREGRTLARLARDGEPLLAWLVEGTRILEAEPQFFAGRLLGGVAFARCVEKGLDTEIAEAAWVLRRGVFIGLGRRYDFDRIERAEHFASVVGAACHTFGPDVVGGARRVQDTIRDWSDEPDGLFASLDEESAPATPTGPPQASRTTSTGTESV